MLLTLNKWKHFETQELKQLKATVSQLQADLMKKDEEISRNKQLLQKEQRLVAHIRGLISHQWVYDVYEFFVTPFSQQYKLFVHKNREIID